MVTITPESLGSAEFKTDYGIRYAYIAGAMYKGIGSKEIVVSMGKAGFIAFLGTGGLRLPRIEEDIKFIQSHLNQGESYGMNLLCNIIKPEVEQMTVDLFLKHGIKFVEAAAFMQITPALAHYRLKGIHRNADGKIIIPNRVIAKVSRPEIAEAFMSPVPSEIVTKLVEQGKLTIAEAELATEVPVAYDICLEADSGGHTDQRVALTLIPSIMKLREEIMAKHHYPQSIRIGAAGGIGTPAAAAAMFIMGADFILTGSINQCTVEAGTSDEVKDMLQDINIQDTAYAPAGDMFELGAKVQVLRKGLLFPARANKLYDLYTRHDSLDAIDEKTKTQIQERYFGRSFQEVWDETKAFYAKELPHELEKAEKNPKQRMSMIFRWYFIHTTRLAMKGSATQKTDYQIHCGSALGAFNQWVKGTPLENWHNRHVDEIAKKMMEDTAKLLNERFASMTNTKL
jgi:trans-AT polyketide synthase/acyltransferase/oxidoreductase domain-containing protein